MKNKLWNKEEMKLKLLLVNNRLSVNNYFHMEIENERFIVNLIHFIK